MVDSEGDVSDMTWVVRVERQEPTPSWNLRDCQDSFRSCGACKHFTPEEGRSPDDEEGSCEAYEGRGLQVTYEDWLCDGFETA